MKRTLIILVLVLGAGGGGYWWWKSRGKAEVQAPPKYAEAKRGNMQVTVSSTGTVEPEFIVEIKSKASGTLQTVTVQAGDQVKKGALLIEIDPIVERRKLTQAQAELSMAQAQRANVNSKLEFAQGQLTRDAALHAKGLVAREAVDQLRKDLAVLRGEIQVAGAQLQRARAGYEEAKDRLAETKIVAPMDATVLDRAVNPGQVITAGTAQGGQTLLTLANLARLFVRVKVDEADVTKVAIGQQVHITADALPGRNFKGTVLRVAPQGKVESNVTVFEVIVEVNGEGLRLLRPMLSANVNIRVGEVKNALLVPRRAVQQQQGKSVVVLEGGATQPVQVGLADDQQIEIKSGLKDGARVLVPRAQRSQAKTGQQGGKVPGLGGVGGGMGGGMRGMGGGH